MDLNKLFELRVQKLETLNNFIALYSHKKELVGDLQHLAETRNEIKELLISCTEILNEFQNNNRQACADLLGQMQKQQISMLNALENVMNLDAESRSIVSLSVDPNTKQERSNDASQATVLKEISNTSFTPSKLKPGELARMSFNDYIKSPFTSKRMKPIALQFCDFERTISAEEFSTVPS